MSVSVCVCVCVCVCVRERERERERERVLIKFVPSITRMLLGSRQQDGHAATCEESLYSAMMG